MDYSKLDSYLEDRMPNLLDDLKALVAINSERGAAEEDKPFGSGPAEALAKATALIEEDGFTVRNFDNYVITADYADDLEPGLDILAHLDVVPAGDGWSVTEPFAMKIEGDRVYGRGTVDDKGPALCALYAMKAVRDCGFKLKKNVRLILGSDEECGSSDIAYYFSKEKSAPMSLSPDADYPLINIEKGRLQSGFKASLPLSDKLPRLLMFDGGVKTNVVPDKARAVIEGLTADRVEAAMTKASAETLCRFTAEPYGDGSSLLIRSFGATAHGSTPQHGVNALTGLLSLLSELPLADAPVHTVFKDLAAAFPHGDFTGEGLGVAMSDEKSETSLALTILTYSPENGLNGQYDCRACLKATDATLTDVIGAKLTSIGLEPYPDKMVPSHCVDEDSFLVKTLMGLYNGMTGLKSEPLCIGGGTYVHDIEGGVAFGVCTDDLDNHMHGADEFITMEQLLFGARIYARAIIELCG